MDYVGPVVKAKGRLYMNIKGRGVGDYYKCRLVAPLCHLNSLCLYLNVRGGSCSRRDADRELLVFLVEGEVTYTFRVADPDSGHVVGAIRTRGMERGRGVG